MKSRSLYQLFNKESANESGRDATKRVRIEIYAFFQINKQTMKPQVNTNC